MIEQLLFWVFAILSCGGAIAVVATQNVVRMAIWLVVSLGSVAALFFLLDADFLGAAQLLIYVGGTIVLMVFGVMLTASGPYLQIKTSPGEAILGVTVGVLLLFVLVSSIGKVEWDEVADRLPSRTDHRLARNIAKAEHTNDQSTDNTSPASGLNADSAHQQGRTIRQIGLGLMGLRPDKNLADGGLDGLAAGYLLPFEIISIHLLVVLIGAAYLARAKRRPIAAEPGELVV